MTGVVRVGLVGLMVKRELGLGPSVADSELKAPSNEPRSREESKCGRIARRIGLAETKKKEGAEVEQEERKSLREGVPLDRTTRGMVSLVASSKRVLSALIGVSLDTVIDTSRLGFEEVKAKKGTRAVGEVRATATVGTIGGERVGFSRTKNKEKEAAGERGGSLTKGVLSHRSALLKVIRLSASASRSIWSMIEGLG